MDVYAMFWFITLSHKNITNNKHNPRENRPELKIPLSGSTSSFLWSDLKYLCFKEEIKPNLTSNANSQVNSSHSSSNNRYSSQCSGENGNGSSSCYGRSKGSGDEDDRLGLGWGGGGQEEEEHQELKI